MTPSPIRMLPMAPQTAPYAPFVLAAFAVALLSGSLLGAVNLWRAQSELVAVPLALNRVHGLTQLFGFMLLMIMGVSFQIAPAFLGGAPAKKRLVRFCAAFAFSGVAAVVVGFVAPSQIGHWIAVIGAALLCLSVTAWLLLIWRLYRKAVALPDSLACFVMAGTLWWWLASISLVGFSLGQAMNLAATTRLIDVVYATALWGGTGSWLLGIFLRAGACTLKLERPPPSLQKRLFVIWQFAAALACAAAWVPNQMLGAASAFASALALFMMIGAVRPFRKPAVVVANEPLIRRAVLAAFGFAAISAVLHLYVASASVSSVDVTHFQQDGARHALTMGWALLTIIGFAGRMVPGFESVAMVWGRAYNFGVLFVILGALMRVFEVFGTRSALLISGASGGIAFVGIGCVAASMATTLKRGAAARRRLRNLFNRPSEVVRISVSLGATVRQPN